MQFPSAPPSTFSLTLLIAALALSACGGGAGAGDDTKNSMASVTPTLVAAEPAVAASATADKAASAVAASASQTEGRISETEKLVPAETPVAASAASPTTARAVEAATTRQKASAAPTSSTPSTSSTAATPVAVTVAISNNVAAPVTDTIPPTNAIPMEGVTAKAMGVTQTVTQAATSTVNAVASAPPTTLVRSVLQATIDSTKTFASDNWLWALECAGKVLAANSVPETGVLGKLYGSSTLIPRFSRVADPFNSSRKVLNFTINRDDPLISGAPRCELGYSPSQAGRLPATGQEFWYGFGLYLPGWVATPDEQIVAQWQTTGTTTPLNPPLAFSVVGNAVRIVARGGSGASLTKATTSMPILVHSNGLPTTGWTYFVVKARVSYVNGVKPYMQIWRDGVQIADSSAPIAYNLPGAVLYAKFGHYHWIDESNPWPASTPSRTLLHRAPIAVVDNAGVYTEKDIRGFLMRN